MGKYGNEMWDAVRRALSSSRRASPIQRVFRSGNPPLSYAQEGIWLHEQLYPDTGAYNTTLALEFIGSLDIALLEAALNEVVRRHDILRTSIRETDGLPYQMITRAVRVRLGFVDLRQEVAEARPDEVRRLAFAENMKPFDLRRAPLWRFMLLRLAETTHVLLFTVHHIVWDQASYSVFLDELTGFYTDTLSKAASKRQKLAIQYADFAHWEREQSDSGRMQSQIEYWKKKLQGCSWQVELPIDKQRSPNPTFVGRGKWFQLQSGLGAKLKKLTRSSETTVFMTMLAAFVVLLARYGNNADFVVGTPFSKRQRSELRPMIGPLINLLMLRFDVHDNPTTLQLLQHVRSVVLEAYANQDAPFEQVIPVVQPDRDRGGRPLVQAMFTFYRMPREANAAGDLQVRPFDVEDGKARMDLELFAWEAADGINGRFIFKADLFTNATMERISQHFLNLLSGMITDPSCRLSDLPLLTRDEKHQLLVAWNDSARDFPREKCIHQLFEEQATRTPEATAATFGANCLSYAELNRRANRLAHRLRDLGVVAETPVGICAGQSLEMVIGMLAVLKAGGAYVPLDPACPRERLAFMIGDAHLSILLTRAEFEGRLRGLTGELLGLEDGDKAERDSNLTCTSTPDGPAYIIYSSGSTGEPKGILTPHRAVVRLLCNSDYVQIQAKDRIAQAANTCFDATTFEVWGALLHGAGLVGLPKEVLLSPRALSERLREDKISVLFLTTALFNLVASQEPRAFHTLRTLLFGGEAVKPDWVRCILEEGPPRELLHVYGPTENTVFSTWYRVREVPPNAHTIPIGKPIANTSAYVLDDQLQLLPIGIPGELYLGGAGLARGYLNRPELSAEKFITDPFDPTPNARLYRTGDRVRLLADGQIEFVSRLDNQAKVRGFRIEPGEIEAALLCHPLVQEVAVVVQEREDHPDDKCVVACVVPPQEETPTPEELRHFLKKRLPEYMLPTAFVPLESLPLTASGKVAHTLDHHALEELIRQRQMPTARVAPTTSLQRRLAKIWQEVLWMGHEVGIHDDFFDLGGHSLLAVRLVVEIELPLAALFQLSTIAELAGFLETETPSEHQRETSLVSDEGQRPTVLVIDTSIPYFNRDSGSRRMFELLKIFQRLGYQVFFVADNDVKAEPYSSALEAQGIEVVHTIYGARGRTITIEEQIRAKFSQLDVAWVCKPEPFEKYAPILREIPGTKLLYDTIDLHFLRMKRAGAADWCAMQEKEIRNSRCADLTITVSEVEKELLAQNGISEVAVIPNIHAACDGESRSFQERAGVLFIGFYKHAPNVDAAVWLCEAIMPRIWKELPDVHVTLLGSVPTTIVKNLAGERVSVPGFVGDVGPYFRSNRIFVAPLLYGAGIKGKVGQSLEYALPIVSTSIGIEGMDLVAERDVLLADDAESFAAQILRLYCDEALWKRLAESARGRLAPYSPEAVQERMKQLLGKWK